MSKFEKINEFLETLQNEQNNRSIPEFEGYSPTEMLFVVYDPFGDNSPLQLLELSNADYSQIPIFNQIRYLLQLINESEELKLTAKSFLPPKIVADIYNQKFIKEELIESGVSKLYRESASKSINLTRILLELSGLVKKRNKKLSLTPKGKEALNKHYKLLRSIVITFGTKFNWAYYDGCGQNDIGQLGFGFSLILLNKYGSEKRPESFYGKKYLKAFPSLLEQIKPSRYYTTKEEEFYQCYSLRTFKRFLSYFGLIEIDAGDKWDAEKFIKKTVLFDKLIKIQPHTSKYAS